MKNKYINKIFLVTLTLGLSFGTVACNNDHLEDVKNLGAFDTDNYFKNEQQCFSSLIGVYDVLRKYSSGFENMVTFFNAGSDDFYAGGGSSSDGAGIQSMSNFSINPTTMPASYWRDYYQGIARANLLIQKLPNATMDELVKNRFAAEAKTLRALYYFELLRMFGHIPLILEPIKATDDYNNIPQASMAAVYSQIEADLLESIPNLPILLTGADKGRMTQGTARAILGKIYLYDKKNNLAAAQFQEVNGTPGQISQYGYQLVSDYASLWKVDNKFTSEAILEVMHTNKGSSDWGFWGSGKDEGNSINIMVAPRSYNKLNAAAPDLFSGWAFNVATIDLFNFMQNDPRSSATLLNIKQLKSEGKADYSPAYLDTGYFLNKYVPRKSDVSPYPGPTELNFHQNYIAIRLADTYLMEAEALGGTGARAQALIDAVRARVNLGSVPVSINAIKNERRRELAGEGHRYFDLVRWGDAPTVLSSRGFVAGKNEILPIPTQERTNTILEQNPNY